MNKLLIQKKKKKQEPLQLHFEQARDALAEMNGAPTGGAGPWHGEDRLPVQVRVAGSPWLTPRTYLSSRLLDLSLPLQGNLRSLQCASYDRGHD